MSKCHLYSVTDYILSLSVFSNKTLDRIKTFSLGSFFSIFHVLSLSTAHLFHSPSYWHIFPQLSHHTFSSCTPNLACCTHIFINAVLCLSWTLLMLHCCSSLQGFLQLHCEPDPVVNLRVPQKCSDVARRPVLHSAGHGVDTGGALRHPGGQWRLGMPLRGLSWQQRCRSTNPETLKNRVRSGCKQIVLMTQ